MHAFLFRGAANSPRARRAWLCKGGPFTGPTQMPDHSKAPRDAARSARAVAKGWRPGFCAVTHRTQSCYGSKGFWELSPQQTHNFSTAASACLTLCAHCRNCAHVSVSLHQKECSWFLQCDPDRLQPGHGFRTYSTQKSLASSPVVHLNAARGWQVA